MSDILFDCPECNKTLEIDADLGGYKINCPSCSEPIVVPSSIPASVTTAERDKSSFELVMRSPKKLVYIIVRYAFVDLPKQTFLFLVRSIPWLARFARVLLYIGVWIILSFWPFLLVRYVWYFDSPVGYRVQWFVINTDKLIYTFGYVWAAICITGSGWGMVKWISLRHKQSDNLPH
jgi:hypothetical protein